MARRKSPADPKAPEGSDEGAPFEVDAALLSEISGSQSRAFAASLFRRAVDTIWFGDSADPVAIDEAMQALLDAFRGIKPRDEAEGMLAAQMLATHNAAMECMRRAMLPGQTFEGRDQNLKHAAKLMSLYERQLAALDKRRGGGRQKITVEHVNVHAGGQAIVGDVHAAALQPHSPQPQSSVEPPTMLSDDSASSGDGEELARALAARPVKTPSKKTP